MSELTLLHPGDEVVQEVLESVGGFLLLHSVWQAISRIRRYVAVQIWRGNKVRLKLC